MKGSTTRELGRLLLFGAAVLVLVFVARVYRASDNAVMLWDDHVMLEPNATYRRASFGELMTHPLWLDSPLADARGAYFRPFVLLSFRADIALGGAPEDFHVTNLLLHIAVCAFLGVVAVRVGASYPAAICAMGIWGCSHG